MFYERLENETDEELIYRICKDKDNIGTWESVRDILNNLLNAEYTESKYRKQYQAFKKMFEANHFNSENEYLDDLKEIKDEIYKERRKLQDQRREYNKNLTSDARAEHLTEELLKAANNLNKNKILTYEDAVYPVNIKKEAVLCWSDWHYGMVTDNIWNKYNTDICIERVIKMVQMAKEFIKLNGIDVLNIVMLGDAAHGALHVSCRVQSEEETCDQLMNVSEIMAEAISDLSSIVNEVRVYTCYGNHMRTVQNKNDSIHSDNMEKIIPWWLKQRLKDNSKVSIYETEYKEFTKLNVLGYNIVAVHGDLDNFKNLGVTVNTIFSRKMGETIDYTISGDKHHLEEFEQFDIESILIRSLCGTDDYANGKRLYSKAGQTLMIFNNQYGRESTYHIPL